MLTIYVIEKNVTLLYAYVNHVFCIFSTQRHPVIFLCSTVKPIIRHSVEFHYVKDANELFLNLKVLGESRKYWTERKEVNRNIAIFQKNFFMIF